MWVSTPRHAEPIRKFRAFGSEGIYDDGTVRAAVYFELLARHGVSIGNGHLLDLGSGFGGFGLHAARQGACVTAIDGDEYRLRVLNQRLRAETRAVRQRVTVLKADAPRLAVRDALFDVAITIGVVEWVPLVSSEPGEPREVQRQALAEIRRVLKPGGTYVLATKNRWYPLHMWREPQTRWPLVDILPRPLAQRFARTMYGQEYRTYNHSARGWESLLHDAGFGAVHVLVPVWYMHWPIALLSSGTSREELAKADCAARGWIPDAYLRKTRGRRAGIKRLATTAAWSVGLEQVVCQGFVLIATA